MLKRNLATTIILIATLMFPTMLLINVAKANAAQFRLEGWNTLKDDFTTGLVRSYAEGDWIQFKLTIDNTGGAETYSGNVVMDLDYNITVGARTGAIGIDAFRNTITADLWSVRVFVQDINTVTYTDLVPTSTIVHGAAIDTLHFEFSLTVPADTKIWIVWENHLSVTGSTNLYSGDPIVMGSSFWPGARLHVEAGLPGIVEGLRSVPIMRPPQPEGPPVPPESAISGVKFYDADVDGVRDFGEVGIEGWKIELYKIDESGNLVLVDYDFTSSAGDYIFYVVDAGTYRIVEVMPLGSWVQTAPTTGYYQFTVAPGTDYSDNDFGNVCLMPGAGGLTLGFWTNKNGQALITASDVTALNALNLFKPTGWTYPPFSATLNTAKTQIKNYLLSANAVDMRWMLSAQLIATELDVRHSYLSASTIVYVGPSTYVLSGFITIGNIMNNANNALSLGTSVRATQEYWKNLLDGVNNNRLQFVCPAPCYPIVYP